MFEKLGLGIVLSMEDKMGMASEKATRGLKGIENQANRTGQIVRTQTDRMTAALSRYARGFTVGIKLMGLGAAVVAPIALLGKEAIRSEHALTEVKSLLAGTGRSGEQMNEVISQFEDTIDRIAPKTRILSSEMEGAAYDLVSALGPERALAALDQTQKLAVAGKGTMQDAVQSMTSGLLTFGVKMGDSISEYQKADAILNAYSETVRRYKTTLPELSAAMQYATAQSSAMGWSLGETLSAIGMLQSKAMKGTQAGTALSAFLRGTSNGLNRLNREMETLAGQTGDMSIDDFIKVSEGGTLGGGRGKARLTKNPIAQVQFMDATGHMRPIADVLSQIEKIFHVKTKEDALKLKDNIYLLEFFQDEGARALSTMMAYSKELEANTEAIENSNSAQEMYNIMVSDTDSLLKMVKNSFAILGKTIGKIIIPDMRTLAELFWSAANRFAEFAKDHPTLTHMAVAITAIGGALMFTTGLITVTTFGIKTFIESIGIIITQLHTFANTIPVLWVRLKLLAFWEKVVAIAQALWNVTLWGCPIVWIIGLIALLGAAIYLLIKHWDLVTAAIQMVWDWLKNLVNKAPDWLLAMVAPMLLIVKHWDKIRDAGKKAWEWIKTAAINTLEFISNSPIFKTIFKVFDWAKGALNWIGIGGGVPSLPGPSVALAPAGGMPGTSINHSADYSTHRTNITVTATDLDKANDIANRVAGQVSPRAKY